MGLSTERVLRAGKEGYSGRMVIEQKTLSKLYRCTHAILDGLQLMNEFLVTHAPYIMKLREYSGTSLLSTSGLYYIAQRCSRSKNDVSIIIAYAMLIIHIIYR